MVESKKNLNEPDKEAFLKEIEGSILFEFQQLYNTIFRVANKMIEDSSVPIRIEQLPVLMCLYFYENQTQQSISTLINRDKSSVFRTTKALEKKGLLSFKKDEHDARRKQIELTETGKFVALQIGTLIKKIEKEIGEALSQQPKEKFLGELRNAAKKIDRLPNS
ncbi:MAG TPA: MarR family transcriptional regulator [Chitinophagaceae bacterium]|nr:MarR family transcriptional regulator [Chitinophagaceae bacterium]